MLPFRDTVPLTPKGKILFSNIAIKPPNAALKPTLLPSFQYISVHQIQLLSLYGSVVHTERNNTAYWGKLAVAKVQTVVGPRAK